MVGNADGADVMYGGGGNDTLIGNSAADLMSASDGNDSLVAGGTTGSDTMFGGDGNDKFVFNDFAATTAAHVAVASVHIVADFQRGSDKIQLLTGVMTTSTFFTGAGMTGTNTVVFATNTSGVTPSSTAARTSTSRFS